MLGAYLSKWQGKAVTAGGRTTYLAHVDLHRLRAERPDIGFLYLKATQGATDVDPLYDAHRRLAEDAGYPLGCFHYLTNRADPRVQARHFYSVCGGASHGLTLLPSGDVEDPDNTARPDLADHVHAFLAETDALWNAPAIPYTRQTYWNPYVRKNALRPDPRFAGRRWWIAHYNQSIAAPWLPVDAPDYAIWQVGETRPGEYPGVPAPTKFTIERLNPRLALADISFPRPAVAAFVPAVWSFVTVAAITPDQEQAASLLYDNLTLMFEDFKRLGRVAVYDPLHTRLD